MSAPVDGEGTELLTSQEQQVRRGADVSHDSPSAVSRRHDLGHGVSLEIRDAPAQSTTTMRGALLSYYNIAYLCVVSICALPIVLLAVKAAALSRDLGSSGCLPNGVFQLPGPANIWRSDLLFTITITTGLGHPLSYTRAKVIDLIWDVCVGRGGQALLVYLAYKVFHRSLTYVKNQQSVSFPTFGAVAFGTPGLSTMWCFLRACCSQRFRCGILGMRVFVSMLLATVYITSIPTLFSAMTGYAPIYSPTMLQASNHSKDLIGLYRSICLAPDGPDPGCTTTQCGGLGSSFGTGLQPGWGYLADLERFSEPLSSDVAFSNVMAGSDAIQVFSTYWNENTTSYNAAMTDPQCSDWSYPSCTPLQKSSRIDINAIETTPAPITFSPPLLNLQRWYLNASGIPSYWACNEYILDTNDLYNGNVTGTCTASDNYQWGFSFLLLFIVSVMNFLVAILLYALWLEATMCGRTGYKEPSKKHGYLEDSWKSAQTPTVAGDAVAVVKQMETHYGTDVGEWTSYELDTVIWRGRKGMCTLRLKFNELYAKVNPMVPDEHLLHR